MAAFSFLLLFAGAEYGWSEERGSAAGVGELGIGYGRQVRGDIDLNQIEIYWRQQLLLDRQWGEWQVRSALEFAAAYFADEDDSSVETSRFSIMPQLFFEHGRFAFIAGLGVGVMAGDTEYPHHNLGGSFLLNSKLALQCAVTDNYSLELGFYHQSNAGIYEYNASLNMAFFSLARHF